MVLPQTFSKDLKDIFPYNAIVEDLVLNKNSIFGSLTLQDFSHKVKIGEEGIRGFEGKIVYDLRETILLEIRHPLS